MANKLYEVLESRILLLDGGFGTMVQQYGFTEEDYRGERFRDWNVLLKGCNDLLAVTRPGACHRQQVVAAFEQYVPVAEPFAAVILLRESVLLHHGAEAAVEQQDAGFEHLV